MLYGSPGPDLIPSAIVVATLSGLFGELSHVLTFERSGFLSESLIQGVYFVLFMIAVWSTLQRSTPSSRLLRIITIVL
jgi:hypothetical protein